MLRNNQKKIKVLEEFNNKLSEEQKLNDLQLKLAAQIDFDFNVEEETTRAFEIALMIPQNIFWCAPAIPVGEHFLNSDAICYLYAKVLTKIFKMKEISTKDLGVLKEILKEKFVKIDSDFLEEIGKFEKQLDKSLKLYKKGIKDAKLLELGSRIDFDVANPDSINRAYILTESADEKLYHSWSYDKSSELSKILKNNKISDENLPIFVKISESSLNIKTNFNDSRDFERLLKLIEKGIKNADALLMALRIDYDIDNSEEKINSIANRFKYFPKDFEIYFNNYISQDTLHKILNDNSIVDESLPKFVEICSKSVSQKMNDTVD